MDEIKKEKRLLLPFLGLAAISLLIAYPRLSDGVPTGIDSSSHIFQVLNLYENFKSTGKIPLWCRYWYCGFPFLLFYPPLSYLLAFTLALTGIPPILSYKIVESFFYVVAPFTIYFLARNLNLSRRESYVAALGFNLIPSVMSNFVFWDRYPTIVAVPLFALLSAFLVRYLKNERFKDLVLTTLTFSLLLLTHHYSAFCAFLAAFIICLSYLLLKRNRVILKRIIKLAVFTGVVSSLLALFWLAPFLNFSNYLSSNPFTNGDVWDNYMPPEHWDKTLYKLRNLDLIQWLFAVFGSAFFAACRIDKGEASLRSKLICASPSLFFISTILIKPFSIFFYPVEIILIMVASIITSILLISSVRSLGREERFPYIMSIGWFFIFAWLSFGRYAILFQLLPYWTRLDTYRFSIYACIPECILVGKLSSMLASSQFFKGRKILAFKNSFFKPKTVAAAFVASMLISSALVGHFIVADDFSYRPNGTISTGIVQYFRGQEDHARVLSIGCPDWIFLLPLYTGKPLVDGWYPQAKILPYLVDIDDYTLNELIKTYGDEKNDSARIELWETLISNFSLLGVEWVLIPEDINIENTTLSAILIEDKQDFSLDAKKDGILIYKTKFSQSLIQTEAKILATTFYPEKITIVVETNRSTFITVKEAYFPEWTVQTNASSAQLIKDDEGFIKIHITPIEGSNIYGVDLVYERPYEGYLYLLSTFAFLFLIIGYIGFTWRMKNGV